MSGNAQQQQRGIPVTNPGRGGRPRLRDVNRMRDFNARKQQEGPDANDWFNHDKNVVAFEEAEARARPPPRAPQQQKGGRPPNRGPPQPRRGPPPANPSGVETPPNDEPLYSGNGRGSKPVKKTLAHNMEFSGFIPLIRQVYDRMAVEDAQVSRKLPFPIFQHAMVEFLVAFQLHQAKYVLKVPALQGLMDPLVAISASECNIPVPIFDYICGIGATMTPTGDKVNWNLPTVAIPSLTRTHSSSELRPGTFGPITAENHNVYECYISPYVSSEYIIRSAQVTAATRDLTWNPLPAGWFPANSIPTENLLGYRELQRLHPDSLRKCNECEFDESDTITGMLCHSPYVMNLTSGVLGTMQNIRTTKAEFKSRDNSAAFIFKERINAEENPAVLWDEPATLKSPFAFSATASNRANYSTYKRKRHPDAPGTCYLLSGSPPVEWLPTINSNFLVANPFSLQRGFRDRESLRSSDHEEEEGLGTVTQDVFHWLETALLQKR